MRVRPGGIVRERGRNDFMSNCGCCVCACACRCTVSVAWAYLYWGSTRLGEKRRGGAVSTQCECQGVVSRRIRRCACYREVGVTGSDWEALCVRLCLWRAIVPLLEQCGSRWSARRGMDRG
ncbi:hypothetical protein K456DRAFT_740174 [Colletotrichum gloeosporioides 23]|nr:hypothetical protein K456DRAFT_740174 [Colletotrichum gloeosporioides 23]